MIISKKKDFNKLLKKIAKDSVFIIGCSECATLCSTGGEREVNEMKDNLKKNNIKVTGSIILDPACHYTNDKRLLRKETENIKNSDTILVLSCGNGVQTVSEIITDKKVISGTDTLFLGEIKRVGSFEKRCNLCGECIEDEFAGFCPVSRCPKSILNGPCGGSIDGKCEIDRNLDCVWILIIDFLKKNNKMDLLKKIQDPKNWSKSQTFRRNVKDEI